VIGHKQSGTVQIFLLISFFGAICLIIGSIIILGSPEAWKCQAQIALLSIGFDLFYLPFFTRIVRIFILKRSAWVGRETVIKNYWLYLIIGIVVVFEIGYLCLWFALSPLYIQSIFVSNTTAVVTYYLDCAYQNNTAGNTFLLISVFFKTMLSFVCLVFSDIVSTIGYKMKTWNKERKEKFKAITNASEIKVTVVLTFIILDILAFCLLVIATTVITKFIAISLTIYGFVISCTVTIIKGLFFKKKYYGITTSETRSTVGTSEDKDKGSNE